MDDKKYFSRAWAMLTRDKGWIKPILVMAAANLVPVAGALGNRGYTMEWARLTAWGVDAAPKQKNVEISKCIASGWRAFLVIIGWGVIYGMAMTVLNSFANIVPGFIGDTLRMVLNLASMLIGVLWGSVLLVAQIRSAIYEKTSAGYRPDRICEMVGRDVEGFLKVVLINFCSCLVIGVVCAAMAVVMAVEIMPSILMLSNSYDPYQVLRAVSSSAGMLAITATVFGSIIAVIAAATSLLTATATALWMRQFNVPAWGRNEDPLP